MATLTKHRECIKRNKYRSIDEDGNDNKNDYRETEMRGNQNGGRMKYCMVNTSTIPMWIMASFGND